MVGIAADETENQRKTLPKAVRRVSSRILFYYVGATFVLGLNVSANDPILAAHLKDGTYLSPFVLMIQRAGISVLPHIVNAVGLVAVLSVANANLYISVPIQFCTSWLTSRVESCTPLLLRGSGRNSEPSIPRPEFLGSVSSFQASFSVVNYLLGYRENPESIDERSIDESFSKVLANSPRSTYPWIEIDVPFDSLGFPRDPF